VFVQISFPVSYVGGCWNIWIKISIMCSLSTVRKHNACVVWGLKFVVAFLRNQIIWDTTLCQWVAPAVWKEHIAFVFWACFGSPWPLQMKALPSLRMVETTSPWTQCHIPKTCIPIAHTRVLVGTFHIKSCWKDFGVLWYECYTNGGHPCFNFVWLVISWQMCGELGLTLAPVAECSSYSKQYYPTVNTVNGQAVPLQAWTSP
jgi:hypothetical protein